MTITFIRTGFLFLQKGIRTRLFTVHKDIGRKQSAIMKIGTHSGKFHCDEVLACFMLKLLPEYREAEIIRTRDTGILEQCDIVVDVGASYDPLKNHYDHHQRDFTGTMSQLNPGMAFDIKLSSAGLIYLHYGLRVLSVILGEEQNSELIKAIYNKVYESFVREIDAIDNGVSICTEEPKYTINTDLSSRVGHLNPAWNDTTTDSDQRFVKAMEMVGAEFIGRVKYYAQSWWPAREIVANAIGKREQVDISGEIIVLEQFCPWPDHLFELEKKIDVNVPIKYVLFADEQAKWRVQGVPIRPKSFELRVPLYKEWQGLRDAELVKVSGIEGSIFVHSTGFIGGNLTKDGAIQMARQSLAKRNLESPRKA